MGDVREEGSIPGSGRSPGVRNGNHSSILAGKFHGQRNLPATVHGAAKSCTRLSMCAHMHTHTHTYTQLSLRKVKLLALSSIVSA